MITILITGGTGLIGNALSELLIRNNYKVIVLTRSLHIKKKIPGVEYTLWDYKKGEIDMAALLRCDAIIHLAGAGVMDKPWTKSYKKEITDSRVKSIAFILSKLKGTPHKVQTLVSASAIGWYGKEGEPHTEDQPAGNDFLSNVCKAWEQAADDAAALNISVAKIRTGIVLSSSGGAYKEFRTPLNYGIAAILGTGTQTISWIDLDDLCRIYLHILKNELEGAFNAVAPVPVTNKEMVTTIAKVSGRRYIPLHVPSFLLKIKFGERTAEILKDTKISAAKIKETGFTFLYPSLESSVKHLENL